uniref:Uncharacterized protein n=1 Tax=Leersia perrieri TaxID=77586 RepID=A0A0D9XBG6_9ORYZ
METAKSSDACGDSFMELDDELCTFWRHTCTASCTRTKHHPIPIMSIMPDLESSRSANLDMATFVFLVQVLESLNST